MKTGATVGQVLEQVRGALVRPGLKWEAGWAEIIAGVLDTEPDDPEMALHHVEHMVEEALFEKYGGSREAPEKSLLGRVEKILGRG